MLRITFPRAIALIVLFAGIATSGALATGENAITVGPSTVQVNPKTYRFSVTVTCGPSTVPAPCDGLLDIRTVPIKPYRTIGKKAWVVGALPFSTQAGTTATVRGRLLAGALVQAKLHGKVKAVVRIVRDGEAVGSQVLTLKLKRRR
jgi:hypothetical protein